MSEPVERCPLCFAVPAYAGGEAACTQGDCPLENVWIPLAAWNKLTEARAQEVVTLLDAEGLR